MRLKYLGTAAAEGWPGLFCYCENCRKSREYGGRNIRSRSQAVINEDLLIDFPPDTYMHIVNSSLDLTKVENILITHNHSDHFYYTDFGMSTTVFAWGPDGKEIPAINLYGNESVNKVMSGMNCPIKSTEIYAFKPFTVKNYTVTPLKADHDRSQNCLIYIIEDETSKLLYGNDTGYFPDETWEYLAANNSSKFKFVSLDTTSGISECRHGHMGLNCVVEVRDRLLEIGAADENTKFCLHHFSHNGKAIYDELLPIAGKLGFLVSYDGMIIDF